MIDIHCHILPDIDDGSKSLNETIEMARIAESEGINKILNTSHYHPNFEYEKGKVILTKLKDVNNTLKENKIDVEILIGNELYYTPDLLEIIDNKEFYTLNDSKYLLIEFPPTNFPKNLCDIIYEIKLKGYVPILAHVDRYLQIQENPNLIFECVNEGALIQINASSILGKSSKEVKEICTILLDNNMVHLVGTDAHGSNRRRPLMREAYDYIKTTYSSKKAEDLFLNNASLIIANEDIIIEQPKMYIEKKGFFRKLFKK